jgi:hypothetical protein
MAVWRGLQSRPRILSAWCDVSLGDPASLGMPNRVDYDPLGHVGVPGFVRDGQVSMLSVKMTGDSPLMAGRIDHAGNRASGPIPNA